MVHDRTEYMADGTLKVAIESDWMQSTGLGRLAMKDGFSNYGSNLRKNLKFDPIQLWKWEGGCQGSR